MLLAEAAALVARYTSAAKRIATAESCTGGLIAGLITAVPGSSAVLDRGFVTYSNDAKTEMIGVRAALIERDGAVSASVARAMAEGALAHSAADVAVAVTGVAGPGGGSAAKPVGLVHFGLAAKARDTVHVERRYGSLDRSTIRRRAVEDAIALLAGALMPDASSPG